MFCFLNTFLRTHYVITVTLKAIYILVIPYSPGGTGNQKPFEIKSCQARFLCFGVNVIQYNQISQFGVCAQEDFGQIRPDDTEWPFLVQYRNSLKTGMGSYSKEVSVLSFPICHNVKLAIYFVL